MRALLDSLYRLSGVLAAVGMVATLVLVASGILTRPLGIYCPAPTTTPATRWRPAASSRWPTPSSTASTSA
jgi:hypothetical protein